MDYPCECGHAATEVYKCAVRDVYTCPRCWEQEARWVLICGIEVIAAYEITRFGRYAAIGKKLER